MIRSNSEKLKILTKENLEQNERSSKILLRFFLGVLLLLAGALLYISKGDFTPLITVPIILFVIYLSIARDHIAIKKEIAARKRL